MEAIIIQGIWATAACIITHLVTKTYQHKQDCMVQQTNSQFLLTAGLDDDRQPDLGGDGDGSPATPMNGTRLGA